MVWPAHPGLKIKLYMTYNISKDLKTTTIMLFGASHIVKPGARRPVAGARPVS